MIQQIQYWEYMVIECMTVKVKNRNCLSSHCAYDVLVYFRDQRRYVYMYLHSLYGLNNKRNRARVIDKQIEVL